MQKADSTPTLCHIRYKKAWRNKASWTPIQQTESWVAKCKILQSQRPKVTLIPQKRKRSLDHQLFQARVEQCQCLSHGFLLSLCLRLLWPISPDVHAKYPSGDVVFVWRCFRRGLLSASYRNRLFICEPKYLGPSCPRAKVMQQELLFCITWDSGKVWLLFLCSSLTELTELWSEKFRFELVCFIFILFKTKAMK